MKVGEHNVYDNRGVLKATNIPGRRDENGNELPYHPSPERVFNRMMREEFGG